MNAVTLQEASQNLEKLIRQVLDDFEPTIVSTDEGEKVVVIPLEEFNAWQETLYLLSNSANAAHLRESIAQAQAGNVEEKKLIEL